MYNCIMLPIVKVPSSSVFCMRLVRDQVVDNGSSYNIMMFELKVLFLVSPHAGYECTLSATSVRACLVCC